MLLHYVLALYIIFKKNNIVVDSFLVGISIEKSEISLRIRFRFNIYFVKIEKYIFNIIFIDIM